MMAPEIWGGLHFFSLLFYSSDISTENMCFYVMKTKSNNHIGEMVCRIPCLT